MVSEAQQEAIRKEARKILDGFAKTLDRIPMAKARTRPGTSGRAEGSEAECDYDFRTRMFDNAPKKNKDFLIAEKGAWN